MPKKNVIDILNKIRDNRNEELIQNRDNSVFYTKIMALEKGKHTNKQLYRIIEEYSVDENQSNVRELFYEFENDEPKLIAILDNRFNEILPVQEMIKDEKSQEEWNLLIQDIEEGLIISKQKLQQEALNLGISKEEIKGLSELDIDKKVYSQINNINKQNNNTQNNKENKEETINIPPEQAKKYGIIGMNTIPLNQRIGIHGETLKSELGLDIEPRYEDVEEIEWIPSYKAKEFGANIPDVPLVPLAKHKNGELETFPESICKPYKGDNNSIIEINGEEDKVTKEQSSSMFKFANGKSLNAKQNTLGRCESSLAYNTTNNDNWVAITTLDKYDGKKQLDTDAMEIINPYQGREQYDKIREEFNKHPSNEKLQRDDADGVEETNTITPDTKLFFNGKEMTVREIAADSKFKISPEEFITKYNRIIEKNDKISEEEIYNKIEDEVNEEVRTTNKLK